MSRDRTVFAVATTSALAWNAVVLPGQGWNRRERSIANALFATGFALVFGRRVRWRTPDAWVGLVAAAIPVGAYGVAASLPKGREVLRQRGSVDDDVVGWVTFDIPVGTVYSEELIFRGVLTPLARNAFGSGVAGAMAFGAWHVPAARVAGENVVGVVLATAAAGVVFDWLADRGGLIAPALAHLAINVGGALAGRI